MASLAPNGKKCSKCNITLFRSEPFLDAAKTESSADTAGSPKLLLMFSAAVRVGIWLRNSRHNRMRSKITSAFSKKGYEVYEEVPCIALQGGSRRIVAIDRKNNSAFILDPTIRSETDSNQPEAVNIEKKDMIQQYHTFKKNIK